jgi:hypothetical protein
MGKISSYGTASSPSLGDKLIGTSVGSVPVNGTYNFTIQQLSDLISGQITLQKVLDAGNTATKNINLTGIINTTTLNVGNITSTGILTSANAVISGYLKDKNNLAGTAGQILSSTVTGIQWIDAPSGGVNIYNANGTLTGNRTVTMSSYTLSFDKDLIVNGLTIGKGKNNITSNTGIGNYALSFNTSGAYNTALGYNALYSNTTGSNNTAIGASSLYSNLDGEFNISIGVGSLTVSTSGSANISLGYQSLFKNTTGSANISSGYQSLYNNTIGSSNIAIGSGSLNSNTTGGDNVAVGESAGYSNGEFP